MKKLLALVLVLVLSLGQAGSSFAAGPRDVEALGEGGVKEGLRYKEIIDPRKGKRSLRW